VAHAKVSEAAVVGYPHDIKGQGIYAYVTLMTGAEPSGGVCARSWWRGCARISARSRPLTRSSSHRLPKTRSGKDHAPHPAQDRRG